jgi:hypothetical protein
MSSKGLKCLEVSKIAGYERLKRTTVKLMTVQMTKLPLQNHLRSVAKPWSDRAIGSKREKK